MSDTWKKVRKALCIGLVVASVIWGLFVLRFSFEPWRRYFLGTRSNVFKADISDVSIDYVVASVIWGLFVVCTRAMCNSNSSEPQAREAIGYAIVNGKRYDISRYATNNGHPYVWTTDGTQIIGAGITVFIPED